MAGLSQASTKAFIFRHSRRVHKLGQPASLQVVSHSVADLDDIADALTSAVQCTLSSADLLKCETANLLAARC